MALGGSSTRPPIDEPPKPRRRKHFGTLVFLLLVLGITLVIVLVPGVQSRLKRIFPPPAKASMDSAQLVWTNKQAGIYYCPGGRLYGIGVGTYMRQGDALTNGYQPALGHYCVSSQDKYSKGFTKVSAASTGQNALQKAKGWPVGSSN